MKKKKKKSRKPYRVSTTSIGELIQAQAMFGNPQARKNAEKFLRLTKGVMANG